MIPEEILLFKLNLTIKTKKMKNYFKLVSITLFTLLFVACSSDDDAAPEPVNEEEVITTMIVTLNGPDSVVLTYQDLDGDGPDAETLTVSGPLTANTTYDGSIRLLNESEEEVEEITEEIEEEDDEHQFFYTVGTGLDVTYAYADEDENGNPVGLAFTLTTGAASSGALTITLRHEPNKPNTGLEDAEGSTDIEKSFDLEVQ